MVSSVFFLGSSRAIVDAMNRYYRIVLAVVAGLVLFPVLIKPEPIESKSPNWTVGEHPRLLATAAEKSAIVSKLTTPGTASAAIWSSFVSSNFKDNSHSYADGAFLYWVTGNATAGMQAVDTAQAWIDSTPAGLTPYGGSFDPSWYYYQDLLLIYDFAYDLLTPTQKTQWRNYIALQGSKCDASSPGYAPGNINTLWMFCEYASAVELEGENVVIDTTDEDVFRSGAANTADKLFYPINDSNFKITDTPGQASPDYTEGVDYIYRFVPGCSARCIDWSPSGGGTREPTPGQHYYVSYTFTPAVATWKSVARSAIEFHLNYQWHDGYYNGGLNPYGNLVAEQLPLFSEILKRDTGVDLSRDPDVKRIVDMYMYSKLPSSPAGVPIRFNTINDTGAWTNYDANAWTYPSPSYDYFYKSWLRPFIAWGTSQYATDAEGYGQKYLWLWANAYRNAGGNILYTPRADWREALWINNTAVTPYVNNPAVPSASWPKARYFRGKEVIYAQTNDWNTPNTQGALMSMVAGNHNYQNEHDQGDAGSFTFFSKNEDWAIDPGYGDGALGNSLVDHNSVGLDGGGYTLSGIYGVANSTSYLGGFAHFDDVALNDDASAMAADLTHAWSLTSTPYVQKDERYVTTINGSKSSYMIVGDDFQKDNGTHSYEWLLHTGLGNTTVIAGNKVTITGARNSATMDVYSLGPVAGTWTKTTSSVGNVGPHPVLKDQALATTNAQFLHVLLPTSVGETKPTVSSTSVANAIVATVTWPDGAVDTIIWRTAAGTITSGSLTTDAQLTVVRTASGQVTGLVALAGRSVMQNGTSLLTVADGTAPVTVTAFGPTATLYATDASKVRLGLPFVTSASLEDGGLSIPVTNDGSVAYINGGLPLGQVRRDHGILYAQDFNDSYTHDLFRYNLIRSPAEQFGIVSGALELRETTYDWPSFSRRDSTVWRRSGLFPTLIPQLEVGNADVSFRYKFNGALGTNAKFRIYLRTVDRNPIDFQTNQDYVRVEMNAVQGGVAQNQVIVGQRVNGSWSTLSDNETLTSSLAPGSAVINDGNWHTVKVSLLGDTVQVFVDGASVVSGTLATTIPTAPTSGYTEWGVTGSTPVLLDDYQVKAIDQTPPVPPTAGDLRINLTGQGTLNLAYAQGSSTDAQSITLYESASPIQPGDNPGSLTVISSDSSLTTLAFNGADRTKYHAVVVHDSSNNLSLLLPLAVDTSPPAAITDLHAL